MDLSAIALSGLDQASAQLELAASKIAAMPAATPDAANVDFVDLSAAVVAMAVAKNQFEMNLGTLKTADQVHASTLDILA